MLKHQDIIPGMQVVMKEAQNLILHHNHSRYTDKTFYPGDVLTVKSLTQDSAYIYLRDSNNQVWYCRDVDYLLGIIDKHRDANEEDMALHHKKKNGINTLSDIRVLAAKDDLASIIAIIDDNPDFLNTPKNMRTLMSYAIRSQKTEVLAYGFEHGWFKSIAWEQGIITVDYRGLSPLSYAIEKSSEAVRRLLIANGASLDKSIYSYQETQQIEKIESMVKKENIIQFKDGLEMSLTEKTHSNKIKL